MNASEARNRNAQRYAEVELSADQHLHDLVAMAARVCEATFAWLCFAGKGSYQVLCSAGLDPEALHPVHPFIELLPVRPEALYINFTKSCLLLGGHPVVSGPLAVRFLAGVPLGHGESGLRGGLFVMDGQHKQFSPADEQCLLTLGAQISRLLELHATMKLLRDELDAAEQAQTALHSIYESDGRFHVLLDHDHRMLNYNTLFEKFVSYRFGQQIRRGQLFTRFIDPECLSEFLEAFIAAINGELTHQKSASFFKLDKTASWREITYAPVRNQQGRVTGVSYTAIDIREKVKRDEQLSVQKQLLHTIAEMQSHQIRKPVASIIGLLELMKAEGASDRSEYLELMSRSIYELDQKIRDIVDHSSGSGPTAGK